jgi:hypothetical protein
MTTPESALQRALQGGGIPLGASPVDVNRFHQRDDLDQSIRAHHHSLGKNPTQAAPGNHDHVGVYVPLASYQALLVQVNRMPKGLIATSSDTTTGALATTGTLYEFPGSRITTPLDNTYDRQYLLICTARFTVASTGATFRVFPLLSPSSGIGVVGQGRVDVAGTPGLTSIDAFATRTVPAGTTQTLSVGGRKESGGTAGDIANSGFCWLFDMGAV